jgi:hypothetical protein
MTRDTSPRRWHTHPQLQDTGDTVATHQRRVTELCRDLAAFIRHPLHDSDLLYAAAKHDMAEAVLGDVPSPAKERFPALAAAYAKAELQVLTEMGLNWNLNRKEHDMLTLCDKLDAYEWARKCGVTGGEWDRALIRLWKLAYGIGPDAADWLRMRIDLSAPV